MIEEKKSIVFTIDVIEILANGIRGRIPSRKGLFNNTVVKDNKFLVYKIFSVGDTLRITISNVSSTKKDYAIEGEIEFYVSLFQTAENGFYTKEHELEEHPLKSILFYKSRGLVTSPALNNNPFEAGDILKIKIKKCH